MIEIRNLTKKRADTGTIKKLYGKIFHKKFELDVVLAPPFLMRRLNKQFLNKNKTADVLSFLLEKGPPAGRAGRGEIFLNAGKKNLPYLFIHGSLHLLGYEHKKNKDAKKMERKELNILKKSK